MNYIAIDKAYIEGRIAKINKLIFSDKRKEGISNLLGHQKALEDILSQSIEIPVEDSWYATGLETDSLTDTNFEYPNGVIIKPKS